jgi:hypothetical protein
MSEPTFTNWGAIEEDEGVFSQSQTASASDPTRRAAKRGSERTSRTGVPA